ncbi:hypothetical protein FPZ54_07510 [Sphingomonas suaedae]|uniref:SPOR domain-containing protein n=1 Tax=Sphingomonas suaedae TaxID=2599297 RepID=A0A518REN4_9SPHN|nr:SPOR domain-containing protein [Sphingomonas suaedae]QDX25884.1 hypothetical protein FPZ54_07510 [Sphingomonas suaedae]
MTRQLILRAFALAGSAVPLSLSIAAPASAQEVVAPPTPNADRLAAQMRILATDPRNVEALLTAGEASARLNDPSAAAGFFARAQALAPGNPRVQAGQAMVMVRMEKPGEALRLFAAAERAGVAMRPYASDRGLAYDLIGAQGHAQREHRLAMQDDPDDDTIRRFALSLGISGRTDEAMAVLDPLLRRSDRGAWRARAFILAMNNDAAGADKIAASMMGGFGSALSPFFRRLPTLSPADKAFAVHFGELRRTPARIADAQSAPPLPPLAQEPPVRVASADTARPAEPARPRRRSEVRSAREASERARDRQEAERLARQQAEEAEARRLAEARAAEQREAERQAELQRQAEAQRLADARAAQERAEAERIAREAEQQRLARAAAARPATPPPATRPDPEPSQPAPVVVARAPDPAPRPGFAPDGAMVLPAETGGRPPRIGAEDNVIARIVAGITIPASELGVEPMPGREEAPVVAEAAAPPPPVVSPPPEAEAKPEPVAKTPEPKAKPAPKPQPKAKPKPDPAKTDPARHWVQVAGGANVKALPREWKRLAAEAPAEFRGKQAWTTPLRFTNRLLAGPFKSEGAAQDFVNAIAKKGLSAFAWTSEAGQKIEKLDVK